MNSIIAQREGNVGIIRLNRPEKFNSFNREMALLLQDTLRTYAKDKTIRCVLLTGEGKAFCAGQDLAEAIDVNGPGIRKIVREHYNPIIKLLRSIEKPIVCAVNGVAAGAGANMAFACDITLAASSANFIQAFSKIGLVPDSGGTFFLPRIIGFQKATALMMLGDKVSAESAFDLGLIYKVSSDDQLQMEAMSIATTLASMPTRGLWLTKNLLNKSMNNTLEQQLDLEEVMQAEAGETYDYKEGVNAFLEKRKPVFKGE